ncbi:Ig-like domain-containing protein [Paludisphaera sp.]|uniref:Ig-like domain-containing protein n=1 Tax=Paludisphaera sp. TaxID=2017432 RepID=UPI00301DA6E7
MFSGFDGSIRSKRRRAGSRPRVESLEVRRPLASGGDLAVGAAAEALVGGLAPYSDTGASATDGITNVSRPTFLGQAARWANVQLFAVAASSWPTESRVLGQTIAGQDGSWTMQAAYLPDGVYTVTAVETPPSGSPGQPVVLVPSLTIDTIAPRVHGLAFNPRHGTITAVISDVGAGLDESTATDPSNYTVVPPSTIIGRNPGPGGGPIASPAISGFYSDASAYTVQLDFGGGAGRAWPRGRYRFQVRSGGVADRAGNALDGEFTGSLPSGDGVAGGNYIADLFNRQAGRRPPRARLPRA